MYAVADGAATNIEIRSDFVTHTHTLTNAYTLPVCDAFTSINSIRALRSASISYPAATLRAHIHMRSPRKADRDSTQKSTPFPAAEPHSRSINKYPKFPIMLLLKSIKTHSVADLLVCVCTTVCATAPPQARQLSTAATAVGNRRFIALVAARYGRAHVRAFWGCVLACCCCCLSGLAGTRNSRNMCECDEVIYMRTNKGARPEESLHIHACRRTHTQTNIIPTYQATYTHTHTHRNTRENMQFMERVVPDDDVCYTRGTLAKPYVPIGFCVRARTCAKHTPLVARALRVLYTPYVCVVVVLLHCRDATRRTMILGFCTFFCSG